MLRWMAFVVSAAVAVPSLAAAQSDSEFRREVLERLDRLERMVGVRGSTASPALGRGFYRATSRPEVIFQYSPTNFCHVQNPAQMEAYGGFGQVQVVAEVPTRGDFTGGCGWPNGYYRKSSGPAVYRLYGFSNFGVGSMACTVRDPAQMERFGGFAQVKVIDPSSASDLFRGRQQPQPCSDY